jgi:hypothetical protein
MSDDLESRRIRDIGACVGKTIADVHTGYTSLGLRFTDGTYWWLQAGDEADLNESLSMADDDFLNLGLIDNEEYDRRVAVAKGKPAESIERWERQEYERLKAKFEGQTEG